MVPSVSLETEHVPAKVMMVSRESPAAPVGGGEARPGHMTMRRAHQHTRHHWCGGRLRDLPRCRWAVAGPGRASRRRAERSSRRGRLAGGPPPTGTHSGQALRASHRTGRAAVGPDGARNTDGATHNNHTTTQVRQRGGYRSTRPLSAHSATASSRLRPNDPQSWRRRRIHRNMPPTTAAPRPAPPIRPSKPVRARPFFGLVAGTSGAT